MRFPKLLPLIFLLALPVAAAQLAGLSSIGSAMGGVFGGIFTGISNNPAVWMKVILIIIMYVLMQVLVVPSIFGRKQGLNASTLPAPHTKGSTVILSMALAVGMIAPIPADIIVTIFTSLKFMGLIFYVAPVLGIMILTHKMTKPSEDQASIPFGQRHPPEHRTYYAIALIIWVITLFGYINGVGGAVGETVNIPNLDFTAGILNLVAVIAIIYYGTKLLSVSNRASTHHDGWSNLFGGSPTPMPPVPDTPPPAPTLHGGGQEDHHRPGLPPAPSQNANQNAPMAQYPPHYPGDEIAGGQVAAGRVLLLRYIEPITQAIDVLRNMPSKVLESNMALATVTMRQLSAALVSLLNSADAQAFLRTSPNLFTEVSQLAQTSAKYAYAMEHKEFNLQTDWKDYAVWFMPQGFASVVGNELQKLLNRKMTLAGQSRLQRQMAKKNAAAQPSFLDQLATPQPASELSGMQQYYAKQNTPMGQQWKSIWRLGGLNPFTWNWSAPQQRNLDELMSSLMAIAAETKSNPQAILMDGRFVSILSALAKSGISGPWLTQCNQRLQEIMKVREVTEHGRQVDPVILERIRMRIYQFAEAWVRRTERVRA